MSTSDVLVWALFVLGNVVLGFNAAKFLRRHSAWWVLALAPPVAAIYLFLTFRVLDDWLYGTPVSLVGMIAAWVGRRIQEKNAPLPPTQPSTTVMS